MAKQMDRIAVVGTSCSGKTHLAKRISRILGVSHVELDGLYWGANWTPRETDHFRKLVDDATVYPNWVCDGNYRAARDIVWKRVDTIVWLNLPLSVVFRRAIQRTFLRCFKKTELYSNNRESFRTSFFSRDSIMLWVLKTHSKHRNEYPTWFQAEEWSHIKVIQLRSTKEVERFVETLVAV